MTLTALTLALTLALTPTLTLASAREAALWLKTPWKMTASS